MRDQRGHVYPPALDQPQRAHVGGGPAVGLVTARCPDRRDEHVPHLAALAGLAALQFVARRCPQQHVRRVHHAPQRLSHRGRGGVGRGLDPRRVHRRDRQILGQPARQAGDAVLLILLALMRVAAGAIFTRPRAPFAHTAASLIDHDAIAGPQVVHVRARCFYDTRDLMPQDLRLARERNRPAALVAVVIAVPREDVPVGAAQSDRRDAQEDFTRPGIRTRDIPYLDPTDVDQNRGLHGRSVEVLADGGGWWRFKPPEPPEPPPTSLTCISITVAIVLGATRGNWTTTPESPRSIASGFPSASSVAELGGSRTPVSNSFPSLGQSNTWAYSLPGLAV